MKPEEHADYVAKAGWRVLIATGVCTLPALVSLVFGIIEYQKPPNYALNPDPELSVTIPLFFVFASAAASFVVATFIAIAYYFFARKNHDHDMA